MPSTYKPGITKLAGYVFSATGIFLLAYYLLCSSLVQVMPYEDAINASYSQGYYLKNGSWTVFFKTLVSSNRHEDHFLPTRFFYSYLSHHFTDNVLISIKYVAILIMAASFLLTVVLVWQVWQNLLSIGLVLSLLGLGISFTYRNMYVPYTATAIPATLLMLIATISLLRNPTTVAYLLLAAANVFCLFSYEAAFLAPLSGLVIAANHVRLSGRYRREFMVLAKYFAVIALSSLTYLLLHKFVYGSFLLNRSIADNKPPEGAWFQTLSVQVVNFFDQLFFHCIRILQLFFRSDLSLPVVFVLIVVAMISLLIFGRKMKIFSEWGYIFYQVFLLQFIVALATGRATGNIFANTGFIAMLVVADILTNFVRSDDFQQQKRLELKLFPFLTVLGCFIGYFLFMEYSLKTFPRLHLENFFNANRMYAFSRAVGEPRKTINLALMPEFPRGLHHAEIFASGNNVYHRQPEMRLDNQNLMYIAPQQLIETVFLQNSHGGEGLDLQSFLDHIWPHHDSSVALILGTKNHFQRIFLDPDTRKLLDIAPHFAAPGENFRIFFPDLDRFGSPESLVIEVQFSGPLPTIDRVIFAGSKQNWSIKSGNSI